MNKNSFVSYSILYMLYLILSSYCIGYDFQNDINKCGERTCLGHEVREKASSFLPLSIMIVVVFFLTHVHQVDKFSLYSHFSETLLFIAVRFCQWLLLASVYTIIQFFFLSLVF